MGRRPKIYPQRVISAEGAEIGEPVMQNELLTHAVILPISKTGAHNGDTVWSMTEANKVVSNFVAEGFNLINVIFLKDNPDPDVYIMGWFLAKPQ